MALLLDPGAPFLELSTLAGFGCDSPDPEKSVAGGGVAGRLLAAHELRDRVSDPFSRFERLTT